MNIWLVPATAANFQKSIRSPVPIDFVVRYLGEDKADAIQKATGSERNLYCWAFRQGDRASEMARLMRLGDLVLFREKGAPVFEYLGVVCFKVDSEAFGNTLWPERGNTPWKHIYFVKDLQKISVDFPRFKRELGFSPDDRLQGARRLGEDPMYRVRSQYGSFEKFMESFDVTLKPSPGTQPQPTPTPTLTPTPKPGPIPPTTIGAVRSKDLIKKLALLDDEIEELRRDPHHKERAHESLVERFFEILGYKRHTEIKYRQGRVDIMITTHGRVQAVVEVKKDWNLTCHDLGVLRQAFNYAQENGAPIVIITNGDYYAVYDRNQGLRYDDQLVGAFNVSEFLEIAPEMITFLSKKES